tara:strand:+ start:851 stop:1018 length:168 start_codon:yes stop_codon:yes gene_type:complete
MNYTLVVNDSWIQLVRDSVKKNLETWPGGDPDEQVALMTLSHQLDKLALEVMFDQ